MQIIPVIDLLGGRVVRGIGGRRREYRPIESRLASGSDPGMIARAFVEHFGATTCYVADLDAIERGQFDAASWKAIAETGLTMWLDAGTGSLARLERVNSECHGNRTEANLVIGSETLFSLESLRQMAERLDSRILFSLDLKEGQVLSRIDGWSSLPPHEIAALAWTAGISRFIVLDLADVGTDAGTRTLDLCRRLRQAYPEMELVAGGGVRNLEDLTQLADAGCDAALVASALHDGRLTQAHWTAALPLGRTVGMKKPG